jgi:hypothetical protein
MAAKYVCFDLSFLQEHSANGNESAIKPEEKLHIKYKAMEAGIVEPAPLLALHNSLMIAKIMRFEFPQEWYASCSQCLGNTQANAV